MNNFDIYELVVIKMSFTFVTRYLHRRFYSNNLYYQGCHISVVLSKMHLFSTTHITLLFNESCSKDEIQNHIQTFFLSLYSTLHKSF